MSIQVVLVGYVHIKSWIPRQRIRSNSWYTLVQIGHAGKALKSGWWSASPWRWEQSGYGKDNIEKEKDETRDHNRPFKGISSTFRKLKINKELSESGKEALKYFIDEFITVSTDESTVGEKVLRMVLEVNLH